MHPLSFRKTVPIYCGIPCVVLAAFTVVLPVIGIGNAYRYYALLVGVTALAWILGSRMLIARAEAEEIESAKALDALALGDIEQTTREDVRLSKSISAIQAYLKTIASAADSLAAGKAVRLTLASERDGSGKSLAMAFSNTWPMEDIGRRIESVQTETTSAVAAISEITQIITEVSGISATIASAVEEQTATTNEMSRSIAGAAKGSEQISGTVRAVADAAQHTSQNAERTQAAAGELSAMVASLHQLITQVKFSDNTAPADGRSLPPLDDLPWCSKRRIRPVAKT